MENEIYTFKAKISKLINKEKMKVWLTKKSGKRSEFIFKVGKEQLTCPEKLIENNDYILFGQRISNDLCAKIREKFIEYIII